MNSQSNYLLDNNRIKEIVKELTKKIEEYYIFPEIAIIISQFLLEKLEKGSYKEIKNPDIFGRVLSNDLVNISNDKHFYIEYNPSMAKKLLQESGEVREKEEDEFLEIKTRLKLEKYANFHILRVERLPGNIGYFKINDFPPAEFAGDVIVGAFQFLSNCNAFIFDIRNNGGGYPSMVALIISYLLEPNTKLITSFYERKKDKYSESRTLPFVPGKKFPEIPVYILLSSRTASAAEEFAYVLKMLKRATLIGETTRGAANTVDLFPITEKFVIWLPNGRPINPITNDNWEGKGVSPHIEIPQEKALEEAHIFAIQDLLKKEVNDDIKRMLNFELEYCRALYHQIEIDLNILENFQGNYDLYKIIISDNQVFYETANLKHSLITMDNRTFFANEMVKLRFEEENQKKVLILERRDYPNILRLFKK